ncbi:MAG: hypothetical protein JW829_10220 [Pirellulales bacterium]|nr:hypothetical protein [Pirellulales bacterium]
MSENNYNKLPKHTKQILMNAINLRLKEIQQFETMQRANQESQESNNAVEKPSKDIENNNILDDTPYLIY